MPDLAVGDSEHVSLCEALDRVLNKGAVVVGEITISVANVDLIYLGLQVILASIDKARGEMDLPWGQTTAPSGGSD
jgi:gas vesicle structural protein